MVKIRIALIGEGMTEAYTEVSEETYHEINRIIALLDENDTDSYTPSLIIDKFDDLPEHMHKGVVFK